MSDRGSLDTIINVKGLSLSYGEFAVLQDVSFNVKKVPVW